jgi:RimJ/RimL family protein N-acetyltransferase
MDPRSRRAEIGYSLAAEAWGQGYMNEALTALLDRGFSEFALNRVEADVDPRNTASIKCLARLGFALEGLLRQRWIVGGEVSDSAIYGLLRDEWVARRSASNPEPSAR